MDNFPRIDLRDGTTEESRVDISEKTKKELQKRLGLWMDQVYPIVLSKAEEELAEKRQRDLREISAKRDELADQSERALKLITGLETEKANLEKAREEMNRARENSESARAGLEKAVETAKSQEKILEKISQKYTRFNILGSLVGLSLYAIFGTYLLLFQDTRKAENEVQELGAEVRVIEERVRTNEDAFRGYREIQERKFQEYGEVLKAVNQKISSLEKGLNEVWEEQAKKQSKSEKDFAYLRTKEEQNYADLTKQRKTLEELSKQVGGISQEITGVDKKYSELIQELSKPKPNTELERINRVLGEYSGQFLGKIDKINEEIERANERIKELEKRKETPLEIRLKLRTPSLEEYMRGR